MKRFALAAAVIAVFIGGFALGDQGMQDNLTGIDPVTNLPTYAIVGLKQLAVGTGSPDPLVASEVAIDQNGATVHFVTNSSNGVNATAADVVQASSSDAYGTMPYAYLGVFGTGYVGLGPGTTPFFVPGNGVVQYTGNGLLVFDSASVAGEFVWSKRSAGVQVEIMDLAPAGLRVDPLGGSGTRCLQTDNSGNVRIAAGACASGTGTVIGPLSHDATTPSSSSGVVSVVGLTSTGAVDHPIGTLTNSQCMALDSSGNIVTVACPGAGTVTSVTGTAGRIVVTPTTPNPVVDLATFGTASTCAWANVVTDAWGRTTCTANTAPQPAGSYITALTHDVVASGPGSASAEVIGVTDGTSVDHPVAASAWVNGQALALDGSGNIHTTAFQAPLTACTDYVSVGCQTGATDIGGSNATTTVIGVENDAAMRGDVLATAITAPATPATGKARIYVDSTFKNLFVINDAGTKNHGIRTQSCGTHQFGESVTDPGFLVCAQPDFTDLSGSVACSQLPALTGPDVVSSAGSCANKVKGVTDGANVDWPVSGTFANNQAMITSGGHWTTTNECNVFASCAAGGALGGTYPNPTLTVTCGELPAFGGDLSSAGGTCSVQVQAIEETSGPQRLAINAIPNLGAGHFAVLNRPGGTATVVGTEAGSIADLASKIHYYMDTTVSAIPWFSGFWMATSKPTWTLPTVVTRVEYPNDFKAGHIAGQLYLAGTSGTASSITCSATMDGSIISSTGITFTPGTTSTPVVLSFSPAATGSTATSDTFGEFCIGVTGLTGASLDFSVTLVLTP